MTKPFDPDESLEMAEQVLGLWYATDSTYDDTEKAFRGQRGSTILSIPYLT